ncbi:hypothetical protein ACFX13_045779 [Malus domestica]
MHFKGPVQHGLYPFPFSSLTTGSPKALTAFVKASKDLWHNRLGHPSVKIINKLVSQSCISVLPNAAKFFCSDCALGKCSRIPFVSTISTTSKPLELIHTDVWGPLPITSYQGLKYYVIFVDDYTRYCWFYPLKYKSDVLSTFSQYKSMVENAFCTKIIALRSNSGEEFLNTSFSTFLAQYGIQHQLTCPHTPKQNGCAGRKHRHLVETARTLLAASKVPHIYWVEAFTTAIYLINQLPTVYRSSPWESLFHRPPNYVFLKIFGCACFPWLKPYTSAKLDPKSKACVFLGYSLNHKGYKCLDISTKRLYISKHVLLNESSFPFHHILPLKPATNSPSSSGSSIPSTLTFTFHSSPTTSPITSSIHLSTSHLPSSLHSAPFITHLPSPPVAVSEPITTNPTQPINTHSMQTRSKSGIFKPKTLTATKHPLPSHLSVDYLPATYLQASKYPHWRKAMQEEVTALLTTGTWSLVPKSSSQNVVGCKWVFRIKRRKPDGTVDRYKARLVVEGFNQQEGLDYTETFSPVAKPVTIRLLLTLAAQYDWFLNQLDVSMPFYMVAYLNKCSCTNLLVLKILLSLLMCVTCTNHCTV